MPQPDVLALYVQRLPELFATALGRLEQRAAGGDRVAHGLLSRLSAEPVPVRVAFEGEGGGELCLLAGRHRFEFVPASQLNDAEFGYSLSVGVRAAGHGLTLLDRGELSLDDIARGVAVLGSHKSRELFTRTPFAFEIEVADVPVLGNARTKVRMGRSSAPAAPEFVLGVDYDELADAHEQKRPPHQLFLQGKVRMSGDAGKAMLLGVTLAQLVT